MDEPDCYQILQVDPKAEPEVIQAAYRRLAAKYPPVVNETAPHDAERRMKELNAAYAVLGDAATPSYTGLWTPNESPTAPPWCCYASGELPSGSLLSPASRRAVSCPTRGARRK